MVSLGQIVDEFTLKRFGKVVRNCELSSLSYWKIGGRCEAVFYPSSVEGLKFLLEVLNENDVRHNVVGKTSNLLFTSENISGALIILGDEFNYVVDKNNGTFNIGAAATVPWTCFKIGSRGYSGVEHCVGIPGTIGGLIYMNGGSMRRAIGDVISKVVALRISDLTIVELSNNECQFSYRNSLFQKNEYIVIEITINLNRSGAKEIKEEMLNILKQRRAKFPLDYPSCGSVFKSTTELYEHYGPPGKIIENLGLKNTRIGGARISKKHANFIINENNACSSDVINLVRFISDKFFKETGLTLPTEVNLVNSQLEILPLSEFLNSNA